MREIFIAVAIALIGTATNAGEDEVKHPLTVEELENSPDLSGLDRILITGRLSWVEQNCDDIKLSAAGDALRMWYAKKVLAQDADVQGVGMGASLTLHALAKTEGMKAFCKRLAALPSVAPYIGKTGYDALRAELGRALADDDSLSPRPGRQGGKPV